MFSIYWRNAPPRPHQRSTRCGTNCWSTYFFCLPMYELRAHRTPTRRSRYIVLLRVHFLHQDPARAHEIGIALFIWVCRPLSAARTSHQQNGNLFGLPIADVASDVSTRTMIRCMLRVCCAVDLDSKVVVFHACRNQQNHPWHN